MITAFIFTFFINSVRIVMDMIGIPVITELPFGVDAALSSFFGLVYAVLDVFWPLEMIIIVLTAFLGYKALMVGLQMFFGHRISHG